MSEWEKTNNKNGKPKLVNEEWKVLFVRSRVNIHTQNEKKILLKKEEK